MIPRMWRSVLLWSVFLSLWSNRASGADLSTLFQTKAVTKLAPASNYCSAQLDAYKTAGKKDYVSMLLDNCQEPIKEDTQCNVKSDNTGTKTCNVSSLTCKNGKFDPPRAACHVNKCNVWQKATEHNLGKVAELDTARSYISANNEVKLTVYVNKEWNTGGGSDIKFTIQGNTGSIPEANIQWNNLPEAKIPDYYKEAAGGTPCVIGKEVSIPWDTWINKLNTNMVDWNGATVSLNEVKVEITSKEPYLAWDPRLPEDTSVRAAGAPNRENRARGDMERKVIETLNVITTFPKTLVAETPKFTLTDRYDIDVQVSKLMIQNVRWTTHGGNQNGKTTFDLELELESQVQAPFKLKGNPALIEENGLASTTLLNVRDGGGLELVEDCCLKQDGCIWETSNPWKQRLFEAPVPNENRTVHVCAQKWQLKAQDVRIDDCEIPSDFGFRWDVECMDDLYERYLDEECPLHNISGPGKQFTMDIGTMVKSSDVLWICPHMISEHPVATTFTTYDKDPAVERDRTANPEQSVFIENNVVYARIDLKTSFGFLEIEDVSYHSFTIEYDRDPKGLASDRDKGCGDGDYNDVTSKCQYIINAPPKNLVGWQKDKAAFHFTKGLDTVAYDVDADLADPTKNHSKYTLAFDYKIDPGVFPQPYFKCGTKNANSDVAFDNYAKQDLFTSGQRCQFTKGRMVFKIVLDVKYKEHGRRLVETEIRHPLHDHREFLVESIDVQNPEEVEYHNGMEQKMEEQRMMRQIESLRMLNKQRPTQEYVLSEDNDPPLPSPSDWQIPVWIVAALVMLTLLLMLVCYCRRRENDGHKTFEESMEGLLTRKETFEAKKNAYQVKMKKFRYQHIETEDSLDRQAQPSPPPPGKHEDHEDMEERSVTPIIDRTRPGESMHMPMTLPTIPQATAIAAFGEDAPDPDDLPPVPRDERGGPPSAGGSRPTTAANSTRGTILHAVAHAASVTSCRSITSIPSTQDRTARTHDDTHSSTSRVSRITSKRGTADGVMTMSTCTGYTNNDNPGTEV